MEINDLLNATPDSQLDWLLERFSTEAKADNEDVNFYVTCLLAWDQPLGSILVFDPSILEEMIQYPDSVDLGWQLQERSPNITDERAIQINDGEELTPLELSVTKAIARKGEVDDVYMGEAGIFCSGSSIKLNDQDQVFVSFTGPGQGQAGIQYSFYRIFADKGAAIIHFESQPDIWLPII